MRKGGKYQQLLQYSDEFLKYNRILKGSFCPGSSDTPPNEQQSSSGGGGGGVLKRHELQPSV